MTVGSSISVDSSVSSSYSVDKYLLWDWFIAQAVSNLFSAVAIQFTMSKENVADIHTIKHSPLILLITEPLLLKKQTPRVARIKASSHLHGSIQFKAFLPLSPVLVSSKQRWRIFILFVNSYIWQLYDCIGSSLWNDSIGVICNRYRAACRLK
jgi:hypothetical protein